MRRYKLRAGDMDQRVTITYPLYSSPPDEVASWPTLATLYAMVEFLVGDEVVSGDREVSKQLAKVKVHHRSDINTTMRLTHRSIEYDIRAVVDVDGKRESLWLTCRAVR